MDYGIVAPDNSLALRGVIDRLLATSSAHPRIVATSNSLSMLKHLVAQDVGIGLVTNLDATWEIETGRVQFIPLENANVRPSILSLCLAEDRQLPTTATSLLALFDSAMNQLAS